MERQPRAEATRRKIINAAIELFNDVGYGETGLAEIMKRADVTKGAFYYHFTSKEALASVIIEESSTMAMQTFLTVSNPAAPALENIIQGMFAVARLMESNTAANTGRELAQALTQVSGSGASSIGDWTSVFVGEVKKAIAEGDVCEDVDPDDAGETIWVAVLGSHLLSNALGDAVDARLAKIWRVLLRSIVPAESLPYFHEFLARAAVREPGPRSGSPELEVTAQ